MAVKYIDEVKQTLGDKAIDVLTDLFRSSTGTPPQVVAARYRADHPQWLDVLDQLEQPTLFLDRDRDHIDYVVRVYAIPLLEDEYAQSILSTMEEIFCLFKVEYPKRLNEPIALSEICDGLNLEPNIVRDALSYMIQSHGIWSGRSNDFPVAEDSTVCISENVLRHEDFGEILSQFYEWHIINPHKSAEDLDDLWVAEQNVTEGFFTKDDLSQRPKWFDELDDQKKALIGEIDKAVKEGLSALPTIGLRTLLETTILDHIEDQYNFSKNLKKFREAGYITEQHSNLLKDVVAAGNASAHRAYFPNREDLNVCIEVLKHLLHGVYVLKPKVDKAAKNTPARPKIVKETPK